MDNTTPLITAMAKQCRNLILESETPDHGLPKALQPKHLLWMCDQIERNAADASATRLHRWIGFIQGAMLANRILDLDGLKAMFDQVKSANNEVCEDIDDLTDHLDPTSSFKFDIGGQG